MVADDREPSAATAIGEEAVMTDAMEAVRQAVKQKAANELVGAHGHLLCIRPAGHALP